ncbi:eCIS core domain-containing protein [Streptomyces adustus]|uniref:eCIS core domain-containing protein n=1 Tax=Streptomyces adustus TaxID=1609272 RepID=UPI00371F7061
MPDHVHDHDHDHDHDHRQAGHGQSRTDDSRLFKAAAAGRPDVLGPSGMGTLQRAVGNGAVGAMLQREQDEESASSQRSPVHDVVGSGSGQALGGDVRSDMEARLGADFSDVRVHTGDAAHESAKSVGAHAYTVGSNVVFQRDAYDPSSHAGRTTLAHELTHVIQQRSGPVDGTTAPGGIRVSDPSDRYEREASANAERVMSAPAPAAQATEGPAAVPGPSAAVQREAEQQDEEPADVQGLFVQRAEEQQEDESGDA